MKKADFLRFYQIEFDLNSTLFHVHLSVILVLVLDIIRKFILSKKYSDRKF